MITLLHSAADFAHAKLSANQVECDYSQLTDVIAGCLGFETVSECADEGEEPLQLLIARLTAAQSIVFNASLGQTRASQHSSAAEVLAVCMDGIEHVLNGTSQSSSMRLYRSPEAFYAAQVAVDATKVVADDQKFAANIRERCAAGNQLEIGQHASWDLWSDETCIIETEGVVAPSDEGNWLVTCRLEYSKLGRVGFSLLRGVATYRPSNELDLLLETSPLDCEVLLPDQTTRRPLVALVFDSESHAVLWSKLTLDIGADKLAAEALNSVLDGQDILGTPLDHFVTSHIKINLVGGAWHVTDHVVLSQSRLEIAFKSRRMQSSGVVENIIRKITCPIDLPNQRLQNMEKSRVVYSLEDLNHMLLQSIAIHHDRVQSRTGRTPIQSWEQYWGQRNADRGKI